MGDLLILAAGPVVLAVGVPMTIGALLSRFGVRTFIPSRMDRRPEFLAIGPAFVLLGIGFVTDARAFWGAALALPTTVLLVIAAVLQYKSSGNRSKNGT